jgi:hypothetical protein
MILRRRGIVKHLYFRGDAAFANSMRGKIAVRGAGIRRMSD